MHLSRFFWYISREVWVARSAGAAESRERKGRSANGQVHFGAQTPLVVTGAMQDLVGSALIGIEHPGRCAVLVACFAAACGWASAALTPQTPLFPPPTQNAPIEGRF